MAVLIPLAWIAFFGVLIWIKKSGSILSGIQQPLSNGSRGVEASGSYEMRHVTDA